MAFKSMDVTLLVTVYVVNPIPALKLIVCTVLTFAVTVNEESMPELAPCTRLISSLIPALRVNVVFAPLIPIYDCPVPLAPILPVKAVKPIPAPGAVT